MRHSFLVFLLASSLLPSVGRADGQHPNVSTIPLSWTSGSTESVDAGLQELARLSPVVHADITVRMQSGQLTIAELHDLDGTLNGCADHDTIVVRLNDGPDAYAVARRLEHEYYHCVLGEPEDGAVLPCEHFDIWVTTYESLVNQSCECQYTPSCRLVNSMLKKLAELLTECNAGGGSRQWPNLPSPCACY